MLQGYGKVNWMICQNDGENVYIIQYSTAVKIEKIKSRLVKITKAGEMTYVDLNETVKFRGVGVLEILDDEIFTNVLEVKGTIVNGVSSLKWYFHNLRFTPDLKQIGKPFTLPAFSVDKKFNYKWAYYGKQEDNYTFVCNYFIDAKGNPVDKNMGSEVQTRTLTVNTKGEV